MNNKVIFIDFGTLMYRAINAPRFNNIPATHTALTILLSCLKYIELSKEDIIIIAIDSKLGSWRKQIDKSYKKDNIELRSRKNIDWSQIYADFNIFVENLRQSTPFYCVEIDKLEADDIIAYGVKYFKDNECIIIASDKGFEQLSIFNNVKLFSDKTKKYKIIKNPEKLLTEKIYEVPIKDNREYEKRKLIVDLTKLPIEVESRVEGELCKIDNKKEYRIERLRFKKIRESFFDIYDNDKVVTLNSTLRSIQRKKININKNKAMLMQATLEI